jgi:hypothetical protein
MYVILYDKEMEESVRADFLSPLQTRIRVAGKTTRFTRDFRRLEIEVTDSTLNLAAEARSSGFSLTDQTAFYLLEKIKE